MAEERTVEKDAVLDVRDDGVIDLTCLVCNEGVAYPDKGLGRASAAAWKTRHQHVRPNRGTMTEPRAAENDAAALHEAATRVVVENLGLIWPDEAEPMHAEVADAVLALCHIPPASTNEEANRD